MCRKVFKQMKVKMSFKQLRHLTETKQQKQKAAEGFADRLKEYEKRFVFESKINKPSESWYNRGYNL